MRKLIFLLFVITGCASANLKTKAQLRVPEFMKGTFSDDYGIKYTISDTLWIQHPRSKYHIIKWNTKEQYVIARNDVGNGKEGGLYTRIDYMEFSNMEPFKWGFCLTEYKAVDAKTAEAVLIADRVNPKKGCNGFPFSRMKTTDK
ncbi:MAG: hypothetical protein EOO89_15575 [Pedobacter sp.]|nr:MAG: hypothetical protein EOO89_15575 [Pedobacter sp.]